MVIASRLRDGRATFLTASGDWSGSIEEGAVASDSAAAEALLARARRDEAGSIVTDPYLIEIDEAGGIRRPVSVRETIRAHGPTVSAEPG